jgi:hypothetical protein
MKIKVKTTGQIYESTGEQLARNSNGEERIVGFITAAGVFAPAEVSLVLEEAPPEATEEATAAAPPEVPEAPPEAAPKARKSRAKGA